jgi:hypothetical protein
MNWAKVGRVCMKVGRVCAAVILIALLCVLLYVFGAGAAP